VRERESPYQKLLPKHLAWTITRTACASDASVVTIDMEKMENKRKRNARM
jgi:hypothetical protein